MKETTGRCQTICGENASECIAGNREHVECITDMIINRAWSARQVIELGAINSRSQDMRELLGLATDELDGLIAWAQQLQSTAAVRNGGVVAYR